MTGQTLSLRRLPDLATKREAYASLFFFFTNAMDTTKLLGRNIRFHLFRLNLSLTSVAKQTGASAYSLGRVASGKTRLIDPNLISDLMRVFNCDANALLMPIEGVPYEEEGQAA